MSKGGLPKAGTLQMVSLDAVALDEVYQIRDKLNAATVEKYRQHLQGGGEMPPVEVAVVDGVMVLTDGWHRVAALRALGRDMIEATVTKMTRPEARWRAANANSAHGLPLKRAEERARFRVYVETGQHKARQRGKGKPYRDMARDLGRPHTTIRSWMQADFPEVAAGIADGRAKEHTKPEKAVSAPAVERSAAALLELAAAFQSTSEAADRGKIVGMVEDALARLKGSGNWVGGVVDEFAKGDEDF